jgi:NADPH:quinone reductase-like Zn-dependent oxidoreductase
MRPSGQPYRFGYRTKTTQPAIVEMKAIVRDRYGSPDVLRVEEIPTPTPADNEVLVKVHAVAVNKGDWEILRGSPLWVRLVGFGLIRPKIRILGSNFAGRIEAVGQAVSQFQVGEDICGDILEHGLGAFAEFVCVPEDAAIVRKHANLSFQEAASVPEAGLIALQGIRDKGNVKSGQKVLINGAGGGAGTFAIQLAKSFGAEVTAVDNSEKLDLMLSLGADHVVDYTKEDFAERDTRYDFVLDVVGVRSIKTWKRVLQPEGIYLAAGGSVSQIARTLLLGALISWGTKKKIGVLGVNFNKKDIATTLELMESGQITATIDRLFPLQDVPEAMRYLGAEHSKGKVVIVMNGC